MEYGKRLLPPAYVLYALKTLEQKGFEAWCVGGCVRDSLLGHIPEDWDLTTNALPEEVKSCFSGFSTVDTGILHGTVAVLLKGIPVEITTYRLDGTYSDARHPDRVSFSRNLEADLSRRDFTVNALAYHPERGLVDPFGGLSDLKSQTLRCVGKPERRFSEDALRILRCLRFSSTLGFFIHPETREAALKLRDLLCGISHERVREELTKLLCGAEAAQVLRENAPVLFTLLPELSPMEHCGQETTYHCFSVWEHTLHTLDAAPREKALRWAALLHDSGKPAVKSFSSDGAAHFYGHVEESAKISRKILERLRFSNRELEEICTLVKHHGEPLPISEKRIKRLWNALGRDNIFRLLSLIRADVAAQAPTLYETRIQQIDEAEILAREVLSRGDCLSLKSLAVNGRDLLALGYTPGKKLGAALQFLFDGVLEGTFSNEKDILLAHAKERLKSQENERL